MNGAIRVLHVDDEPDFAELAGTFLEREDDRFHVTAAPNAREALDRLATNGFDCVVSDFEMPGPNGIEFLRSVREQHTDLPFILFTGKGSEEVASEAISAGVTDYLQKQSGTEQYKLLANRIANVVEQYRAERSLERARRRFRTLVDETTDVILVVDANGTISYATPSAERILGREPDELVGSNGFEPVHPENQAEVMAEFTSLIENPEERHSVEFRYQRPDESWVWLEARGRNLRDDPVIDGIVVYVRETTDRKQHERELERTSDLLQKTERIANVGGWEIDTETMEVYWTEHLFEILGVDYAEEPPLDGALDLYHEDDRPIVEEAVDAALERGEPFDVEARIERPDGVVRWLWVQGLPTMEGGEVATLRGTVQDITERKPLSED